MTTLKYVTGPALKAFESDFAIDSMESAPDGTDLPARLVTRYKSDGTQSIKEIAKQLGLEVMYGGWRTSPETVAVLDYPDDGLLGLRRPRGAGK